MIPGTVLMTGASGQLARAFTSRFDALEMPYQAPPEADFDITDPDVIDRVVSTVKPRIVLNCAAYNDVEAAETHPEPAYAVNTHAVRKLAEVAKTHRALFIHYGTDFVFDGKTDRPYGEDDATGPLNIYGHSKLDGENAALDVGDECLVLRTSWVYGNGHQNFFHKLVQWSSQRRVLSVVTDQVSTPTYTEDIVTLTLAAIDAGLRGRYHLANEGHASRYETAKLFFALLERDIELVPVTSDAFPSPVRRPAFSALDCRRLRDALNMPIPTWESALERFVKAPLHDKTTTNGDQHMKDSLNHA